MPWNLGTDSATTETNPWIWAHIWDNYSFAYGMNENKDKIKLLAYD